MKVEASRNREIGGKAGGPSIIAWVVNETNIGKPLKLSDPTSFPWSFPLIMGGRHKNFEDPMLSG